MDDFDGEDKIPIGEELVPYVSGATLKQYSGRKVRCWGRPAGPPSSSGSEVVVKTVDDMDVTVRLRAPLGSPLSPDTWLEAIGVAQCQGANRTILAETLTPFAEDACVDVEKEGHRALTHLLATIDDPWNTGEPESGVTHME